MIRRTSTGTLVEERTLRYADLELNTGEHRVYRNGRLIDLTRIEFSLLETLLSHPHRTAARRPWRCRPWCR